MENKTNEIEELNAVSGANAYEESRKAANKLVNNPDALEKFLNNLEEKLKTLPKVGGVLSNIPVLVSMVRSYIVGEYPQLPVGTLIGVVTALIYFLSPVDIIPDVIPGLGFVDDALVLTITLAFVGADVETYKQWREEQRALAPIEITEVRED